MPNAQSSEGIPEISLFGIPQHVLSAIEEIDLRTHAFGRARLGAQWLNENAKQQQEHVDHDQEGPGVQVDAGDPVGHGLGHAFDGQNDEIGPDLDETAPPERLPYWNSIAQLFAPMLKVPSATADRPGGTGLELAIALALMLGEEILLARAVGLDAVFPGFGSVCFCRRIYCSES